MAEISIEDVGGDAALKTHGMGQILDMVPNHMGVMGADNAWWMAVLEDGPASTYAAVIWGILLVVGIPIFLYRRWRRWRSRNETAPDGAP